MFGALVAIGKNWNLIFDFGAGVFGLYLLGAVLVMGVQVIKSFLENV